MSHRNPPPRLEGARWEDKRYGTPKPLVFTREVWGSDPDDESVEQFTERWVVAPHGSRFKVEGGRIWPLYHATSYVREILEEGFRLDKKGGLGGMSTGKAISFTQSLPFACVIANSLVDAIRLAAGRMIPGDVLDRAEREGGTELVEKTIWWYEIDRGGRGGPHATTNLDALEGDARKDVTWMLYKAYLRARSELKLDYDPGFFGVTWRAFVGLDVSNVGVLECEAVNPVWLESSPSEHVPGAFTYHGWNRPPFAPDQDEYRLYDVSSIEVLGVVDREREGGCPRT